MPLLSATWKLFLIGIFEDDESDPDNDAAAGLTINAPILANVLSCSMESVNKFPPATL